MTQPDKETKEDWVKKLRSIKHSYLALEARGGMGYEGRYPIRDNFNWEEIENLIRKVLAQVAEKAREDERGITTITLEGKDEAYCDWYRCDSCGENMITNSSKYCPDCGKKIQQKQNDE